MTQSTKDMLRVIIGILLAAGVVWVGVLIMQLVGGCTAADNLSPRLSSPTSAVAAGNDSNVIVFQAAGGLGGLLLWSLVGWWAARRTPTKATKRLVTAMDLIATVDEKQAVRHMVCQHHPPHDVAFQRVSGCTCDAAERFINKHVKAGRKG